MPTAIAHISDTALWVALYRAIESERADAHFRDPYARRLAGERGEAIARGMPAFRSGIWPMVVRTCVFDEFVLRAVRREGFDTVVNLAAGLDARPWRLDLPAATRWFDVDLPAILAYKQDVLSGERPVCAYRAEPVDLRDAAARRELFERVGRDSRRALVLTEGLLVYLAAEDVASLATDLHAPRSFRWWAVDLVNPKLLRMLRRRWSKSLAAGDANLQFGPAEGPRFFERFGWKEIEFRSTWDEAHRLRREMRMAWLWRFLARLSPEEKRRELSRMGGIVLMERV
ncbi:MAG TPA: SAM-dependent methyltransferase [Thermoanaerobaculia bacterium]|jgi:methyltransferase (TIGR00027 family)